MLPVFRNTVKPLLSGHPLDLAKSPFNRGCLLKRVDFFSLFRQTSVYYLSSESNGTRRGQCYPILQRYRKSGATHFLDYWWVDYEHHCPSQNQLIIKQQTADSEECEQDRRQPWISMSSKQQCWNNYLRCCFANCSMWVWYNDSASIHCSSLFYPLSSVDSGLTQRMLPTR